MRRLISLFLLFSTLFCLAMPVAAAPRIVYRYAGNTEGQRIALTFDDGPHPRYTAEILDILKEYNVKATFFCVGSNAESYPELIRREIAEGHEVANHTYNHYHVCKLSGSELESDIFACNDTLQRITGRRVRLFRPPEGVCSEDVKSICDKSDMTIVLWSVDTRDWAHTPLEEMLCNVKSNVRNGSIILMHDFIGKNSPTPAALRQIIPMLRELGYEMVTVSQLVGQAE